MPTGVFEYWQRALADGVADFMLPSGALEVFGGYCCYQFRVAQECLPAPAVAQCLVDALVGSSHALIFRQNDSHDATPGVAISALFQHLWHLFFGEVTVLPLREFYDRLPLFLRVGEMCL